LEIVHLEDRDENWRIRLLLISKNVIGSSGFEIDPNGMISCYEYWNFRNHISWKFVAFIETVMKSWY